MNRAQNNSQLCGKMTSSAGLGQGYVPSVQKDKYPEAEAQVNPTRPARFTNNMGEEEVLQLMRFIAPVAHDRVMEVLNIYGDAVADQAIGQQPFTPIRYHFTAGLMLPLLPPDYCSGIWHTIETVGRRIYGQYI